MFCGTVRLSGVGLDEEGAVVRGLNVLARGRKSQQTVRRDAQAVFGSATLRPGGGPANTAAMLSRDGLLIVCDAEFHDRQQLRAALGDHAPPEGRDADIELLAAAYRAWDTGCVTRLLGDFAFAIWDSAKGRLFCATDHMRRRPLYRHIGEGRIAFASEPRALLAFPWVERKLNDAAMAEFLATSPMTVGEGTTTFYQGIDQLPGSTTLTFDGDGVRPSQYWAPNDHFETGLDDEACVAEYRRLLVQAVHRRMASGRRFGVLLSGGFDSTAVACIAAQKLAQEGRRLTAVAAVLPPERAGEPGDPRRWIEHVRAHTPNLDVHYVTLEEEAVVAGPQTEFRILDRPLGGWERRFGVLAGHAAALGVDTLFTGFGGDHAVTTRGAGYHAELLRSGRWRTLVRECRARGRRRGISPLRVFAAEAVMPLLPDRIWRAYRRLQCGEPLAFAGGTCAPDFARRVGVVSRLEAAPSAAWRPLPSTRANSVSAINYVLRGASLTPVDRLAMAQGARISHPLFDKDLVEFALSLPARLHVRDGVQRHIMRRAGVGLLPPETLSRPDGNDSAMPDFVERMTKAAPEILREIEVLGRRDSVRQRVDIPKLRRIVEAYSGTAAQPGRGQLAQQALRGFTAAHFVEWFERGNS